MIARHFVVADDLVVPIHNVERTIGALRHAYGAEEGIIAGDQIGGLLQAPAVRGFARHLAAVLAMHGQGLHLRDDGIGDEHAQTIGLHAGCHLAELAFTQSKAAQAGAAHFEVGLLHGEVRRVALEQPISAAWVVRVLVEGHHRITEVVRLLDEGFAFAGHDQAPDVARSLAGDFEAGAIGTETRHARAGELRHLAALIEHGAVVEGPLRHPDPAAWRTGELMREKMRVLHAEAGQHHLAFIRLAVAIGVLVKQHIMPVQDVGAVAVAPG